jgi:adenosine deaminase CECR1
VIHRPARRRGVAVALVLAVLLPGPAAGAVAADGQAGAVSAGLPAPPVPWFDAFRERATDAELHAFLWALPKGGDLHAHLTGSGRSEWLLELALAQAEHGYRFLTRVRVGNCHPPGSAAARRALLLFHTIREATWQQLDACSRAEYERLEALEGPLREAWLDALRLDRAGEGRDEFFERHWQRMNALLHSPWWAAELLARHVRAMGDENVRYVEPLVPLLSFRTPDGAPFPADVAAALYRERLGRPDVRASGVTVRLQASVLRFLPDAERVLAEQYAFVARHRDLFVAVNLVGREDEDRGHPLRFLETFRTARRRHAGVHVSLHAGEVDEPNRHVRDSLLLGAERIGHGFNLIDDPDTLLRMRGGPWAVEISLISNRLLEYAPTWEEHPFPEYLRTGVPVTLATDDRGMWDSTLTDEYFVAVREYALSWEELVQLARAGLDHAFLDGATRAPLRARLDADLEAFAAAFRADPQAVLARAEPLRLGFVCRTYGLCPDEAGAPDP